MTRTDAPTLLERQVELTRFLLQRMFGIDTHLMTQVRPHLPDNAHYAIDDLIEALDEEDWIDPNLHFYRDTVLSEMRQVIAKGTTDERVSIPPERLIGCVDGFDLRRVQTPEAEALQAALPMLQGLYIAAREANDFSKSIRLSLRMLNFD